MSNLRISRTVQPEGKRPGYNSWIAGIHLQAIKLDQGSTPPPFDVKRQAELNEYRIKASLNRFK